MAITVSCNKTTDLPGFIQGLFLNHLHLFSDKEGVELIPEDGNIPTGGGPMVAQNDHIILQSWIKPTKRSIRVRLQKVQSHAQVTMSRAYSKENFILASIQGKLDKSFRLRDRVRLGDNHCIIRILNILKQRNRRAIEINLRGREDSRAVSTSLHSRWGTQQVDEDPTMPILKKIRQPPPEE